MTIEKLTIKGLHMK